MEFDFPEFDGLTGVEQQRCGFDGFVDLKLGGLATVESSADRKEQSKSSKVMAGGGSGPSKTCKGRSNGEKKACCLVDGCRTDLSSCREYHKRHKVCEAHSKAQVVLVGGKEQRFCQQCSRFHSLGEFDETKRSCRRRLEGHNKRRRKPRLGATAHGLPPSCSGTTIPSRGPILPPSNSIRNSNLNEAGKIRAHAIHKEGRQFPFLLEDHHATAPINFSSLSYHKFNSVSTSESGGTSNKMFSDGITPGLRSDCATSLLSCSPQAPTNGLHCIMPLVPDQNTTSPHLVQCWQAQNSLSGNGACSSEVDDWNLEVLVPGNHESDVNSPFDGGCSSLGGPGQADPRFFWC